MDPECITKTNETKKRIRIQSVNMNSIEYLYTLYASMNFCILNKYEIIWWGKKIGATVCHTCWIHWFQYVHTSASVFLLSISLFYLSPPNRWVSTFIASTSNLNAVSDNLIVFLSPQRKYFWFFQFWNVFFFGVSGAGAGAAVGNLIETIIRQQSDNAPLTVDSINGHCKRSSMMNIAGLISIYPYFMHPHKRRSELMCSMSRKIWFFLRCLFPVLVSAKNRTFFH